jgi:hypothetical protein
MVKLCRPKGQGLVEFALILPALLMIVLSIIEGAFLFQSYLAIQHAAREAARFAITYQPPITYSLEQGLLLQEGEDPGTPAYPTESEAQWYARRVMLIKQRAQEQATGLRIIHPSLDETNFVGNYYKPGFFGVRVWGFPSTDADAEVDHPSLPGLPVRIEVHYRWEALDPLIRAIVPNGVLLKGETVMINEGIQVGLGSVAPPTFPPPPTVPGATPTTEGTPPTPTITPTPAPTGTFTPTPAPPTATPETAYIILDPEKDVWLEEGLPSGIVKVYNHPDPGPYEVYWEDNCGEETDLGISVTTNGQTGAEPMPEPGEVGSGFSYLSDSCGPLVEGEIYTCTLRTRLAEVLVPVEVPVRTPDLIVQQINLPPDIQIGQPVTVEVVIANVGEDVVTGTFDIDIYVNPSHTPVLKGVPGQGTAGGTSPKQWYDEEVNVGATDSLNYVVVLPAWGDYTIWAQVDTSDRVSESDDENNISGPIAIDVRCSDLCDEFDAGALDAKWVLSQVGTSSGSGDAAVTAEGELIIAGTGSSIWNGTDGKFQFANQGTYDEDFVMTVELRDYPRGRTWAKTGLMVRESTAPGARYVAIALTWDDTGHLVLHVFDRTQAGATPAATCDYAQVPETLFDGNETNGEGFWLRIEREGDVFTKYISFDGETWTTDDCMRTEISGFATAAVPGIFMAPY